MARRTPEPGADTGQFWWGLAAVLVSIAIASWAAWPIYATPRVAVVAAAGTLIGAGAVTLGRRLRWPWWATGLAALAAYLVAVVPVAIPSALSDPGRIARGLLDGVAGIVLGWKQLLTVSLPAGDYQAVLVPFLVVVAVGSLAATALIASGGRWAPLAALPMLAMTAFGALFGSAESGADVVLGPLRIPAGGHVLVATLAVIVVVVWLLGRARLARARAVRAARSRASTVRQGGETAAVTARRYLLAAVLAVVALGVGAVAAPAATLFGPREALREGVDPLLVLRQQPSPLSGYRASFLPERIDEELFRVSAPSSTERVRIATLDEFDGETFRVGSTSDDRFARVPRTVSAGAPVEITIGEGYRGVWVPVVTADGEAPRFSGPRAQALADAFFGNTQLDAAVVVSPDIAGGLRPGDSYRVDAGAPVDVTSFARAAGGDPQLDAEQFPALDAWVEEQDVPRTGAGLLELVDRLRARGYLSHASRESDATARWEATLTTAAPYAFLPSRSGHSVARIEELFTSLVDQQRRAGEEAPDALLVAAVGDDEQFATAAALLARDLGFASRVVVGVRLGSTASDDGVPVCTDSCTGANLTAWAEARANGGDWVALDATPQFEVVPSLIREGEVPPANPTIPEQPASEALEPPAAQSDDSSSSSTKGQDAPGWLDNVLPIVLTVALSASAGALVVLPFLVFPVAKAARRRWRRRAAVPEVAMVGAWDELLDHYLDHGVTVPQGRTRSEIADAVDRPAAVVLAAMVDQAVFAEHPPGPDSGEASWRLLDDERRELARSSGFRVRLRAALTPASLVQHVRASDILSTTITRLLRKDTP